MKRNLLNPYKWRKRFKRGITRSESAFDVGLETKLTLRPSYLKGDWKKDFQRRKKLSWKTLFELIILSGALIAIFLISFFHPFFEVKAISYKGLERVPEAQVVEKMQPFFNAKSLFVISNKNYFLVDVEKIKEMLQKEYSFESVSIKKQFPHFLTIEVKEKPPTLIYDNTREYILVGEEGERLETFRLVDDAEWKVIPPKTTSTDEVPVRFHSPDMKRLIVAGKAYPVLVDQTIKSTEDYAPLRPEIAKGLAQWYEFFQNKTNIPVTYTDLLEGGEEGYIHTREGWGIYVKLSGASEAFPVFLNLLPQINRSSAQYVDMRYVKRVYWK